MEEVRNITFCALLHYPTLHNYIWWILLCRHLSIYHRYPVINLKSHSQPDLSGKIKPFLYSHQSRDSPQDQAWAPRKPCLPGRVIQVCAPHSTVFGDGCNVSCKFGYPKFPSSMSRSVFSPEILEGRRLSLKAPWVTYSIILNIQNVKGYNFSQNGPVAPQSWPIQLFWN